MGNETRLLKRLLGAFDDLVLKFFAEIVEVVTIAGNPHNQVFVVFRLLLGGQQRTAVDDIKLDVMTIQTEVGADKRSHIFETAVIGNDVSREFFVRSVFASRIPPEVVDLI